MSSSAYNVCNVLFLCSPEATVEAPLLSVAACNRTLCASLRAPAEKLHAVYDSHRFDYRLVISSEDGAEVRGQLSTLHAASLILYTLYFYTVYTCSFDHTVLALLQHYPGTYSGSYLLFRAYQTCV